MCLIVVMDYKVKAMGLFRRLGLPFKCDTFLLLTKQWFLHLYLFRNVLTFKIDEHQKSKVATAEYIKENGMKSKMSPSCLALGF